jgi:hypothetical protein
MGFLRVEGKRKNPDGCTHYRMNESSRYEGGVYSLHVEWDMWRFFVDLAVGRHGSEA